MRIESTPDFGSDIKRFAALLAKFRQQLLTAPVAIYICGIEKIYTQVESAVQCCQRLIIFNSSPRPADRPRTKTDSGYLPAGPSKFAILHTASCPSLK